MEEKVDGTPTSGSMSRRHRWQLLLIKLKRSLPFVSGVLATFLAFLLYSWLVPAPQPLSLQEVNTAVNEVLASATPRPAYSAQVYQAIQPSLVLIQAKSVNADGEPGSGLGSGVVISDQGDILTALHVVEDSDNITLLFADGTESTAQVIVAQPENDIAVLRADQLPAVLIPGVLGNPNAMQVGDEAFVVGNPFGLYGSMSAGVISGFNRSFQAEGKSQQIEGLIQIDTAVNPGNSGGPLLNRSGQIIGIVIGIMNPTDEEFFIGIGFAVPITVAGGAAGAPNY